MAPWLVAFIPDAITRIFDVADGWQERRADRAKAKHEVSLERIKQTGNGLKDEYVLAVASYPIISVFWPWWGVRENTFESLELLKQLPEWIVYLWIGIAMAIYGIQKLPSFKLKK